MKRTIERITSAAMLAVAFMLCATSAWAVVPTPTAVWDGNFSTTKVNGWTLSVNGNTVAADKSTITIDNQGFTITPSSEITAGTGVTVLAKMSGVTQNNDNDQILVCAKQGGTGVKVGTSVCAGAMTLHGAWNGNAKWDHANNAETSFSVPASGEFYVAFTTGGSSSYVSEGIYANGTLNLKSISGLRDSASTVQAIAIGGRPASTAEKASNAVISRVMIYTGCLTQQQMKDAIDDMETTKSYSLKWPASDHKGGLNWANFQLPYLTHYVESGSASLNTDKALRQITIPWRPDGTVNGSGATSLYLGITDSSGKLLALSSGADMSTVTTTSSSTFDFSQAYLSAGTQYRYWFLNSDSYSLGDTITEGIQMGCALYYLGGNVSQMQSSTMTAYCPAARFWCSNMTGSEFTATAGGTAVSTSGAYADDITLKGVADGKFTLGGALNAARITLADAAATIEMDSGDSIKAQYLDNSSQKLVIDASNGATAVGTYTLFEGTLASAADADLEVTFPSLGSGYELYTTKTANKISYQVDRTAVNATLTLTANCSFGDVKDSIDWMDSNHSTLEIVNNQESPITLTFDTDITAGSITVSGTGTTIIESSNSAVITAGTVTVPSGSTFDATGASITTCAGAGTFIWSAGYPATVPASIIYKYVGSNNSESPAACDGVTVNGTLKTTGFISLTNFELASSGTYEVVSDTATVAAKSACKIAGNITIDAGATYVNANTSDGSASDAVNYDQSGMVFTIRGTLSMGNTRWSLRRKSYHEFRLYDGAVISGAGQGANGALDWIENEAGQIDTYGGNVTISAAMRVRGGASVAFWVADGATTTISGTTNGTGTFSKSGANGTLNLTGTIGNGKLTVNEGCVNVGRSMAVNIGCGTSTGYVTASDGVVATGSISSDGIDKVSSSLKTFLQTEAKWQGTFVADWAGAHGTRFEINSYGNANSVVEVTKLAGGYASDGSSNFVVTPTVNVSGTMTLGNGYSGTTTTFTKLTGSGTVTFNTYTCNITTLDNFTGTLTPTDSYGTYIGTINLTSTPAFGAKVVTLGTNANIRSIGTTSVSVNNVADSTIKLAVVANDGIYRAEAAYGGANYKTLAEAVTAAETASADPSAVTVYNSAATIPIGYALVTAAGGAMTLRSAGSGELIYWASTNSGDWSGETSNGTHTFYTAEDGTSTTPYVTGDTVVFTSDTQIWSKTAAHGAKFQIGTDSQPAEVHFTRSGSDCDNYILDGSEIEVKSGSVLVVERYSDTNPPTQAYTAWDSYQNDNPAESAINDTVISGAGTVKIGGDTGGHGAVAAVLSGTSTIADTVTIEFADGATLSVPSISAFTGSGVVTLDVSDVTNDVAGVTLITFTDTTPSDASKFSCAAVLAIEDDDLKVYPVAAVINPNTGDVVGTYSTVQEAIDVAVANAGSWYYAKVYESASVSVSAASVLIMLADEDVELEFTTDAGYSIQKTTDYSGVVPGLWGYNKRATDATFTWDPDTAEGNWTEASNWKIGGVVAGRAPGQYAIASDVVVFNSSASVSVPSDVSYLSGITITTDDEDGVVLTGNDEVWAGSIVTVGEGGIVLASATSKLITQYISFGETAPNTSVANYVVKTQANTPSEGKTQYTVVLGAAKIGGVAYETLAEALAVEGETTIMLVQNVTGDVELRLGQILFLNGNTISGDVSGNVSYAVPVYNSMASAWYCVDNRTNSWIGTSGGSWDIVAGWYNGVVPGSDTAVTINSFATAGDPTTTGTIAIPNGTIAVKSITLGDNVALTLTTESAATLTTTETIVLSSGQTIVLGVGVSLSRDPIASSANYRVRKTVSDGTTTYTVVEKVGTIFSVY